MILELEKPSVQRLLTLHKIQITDAVGFIYGARQPRHVLTYDQRVDRLALRPGLKK